MRQPERVLLEGAISINQGMAEVKAFSKQC